jgi:hypothetical protein
MVLTEALADLKYAEQQAGGLLAHCPVTLNGI